MVCLSILESLLELYDNREEQICMNLMKVADKICLVLRNSLFTVLAQKKTTK